MLAQKGEHLVRDGVLRCVIAQQVAIGHELDVSCLKRLEDLHRRHKKFLLVRMGMLFCVTSVTASLFLSISLCTYVPYSVTQAATVCVTVCVTPGCLRHSCVTVEGFCVTVASQKNLE